MSTSPTIHHELHPALATLVDDLIAEGGFSAQGPNSVTFRSDDAYIDAELKPGARGVVTVDAYLLRTDPAEPPRTAAQVQAWINRQPAPPLGFLHAVAAPESDLGTAAAFAVLTLDLRATEQAADFVGELLFTYAEAWDDLGVAVSSDDLIADAELVRHDPTVAPPRSAWLLKGDEASFPSSDDVEEMAAEALAGIFETEWTGPKNGEPGDLALIYFVAPRKQVCFVARFASEPYWQTDVEVNADATVNPNQWWVRLTNLIEIEPITYQQLQGAFDGYLNARGRSGLHLPAGVVEALDFRAADPSQQAELERIAVVPDGVVALATGVHTLEEWREIPSGMMRLENDVSAHLVEPLFYQLLLHASGTDSQVLIDPTAGPFLEPQFRLPGVGIADFAVRYGPHFAPHAMVVEVKLAMIKPESGIWIGSRDFQQLRRYMDEIDTPGLLIDAHRVVLVRPGEDSPFHEFVRADATWDDIARVASLVLEGADRHPPVEPPQNRRVFARRVARRG